VQVSKLHDKQMMSQKGVIKYILGLWRNKTEIRIIIFYFYNLINSFEEKPRIFFLSYINLNRKIIAEEKKEIENNFKTLSNIFKYHIIHFLQNINFLLFKI